MSVRGIIFDIKKFALHDGAGIRTTVFFKGCPLDCWWCHNPEGRVAEPESISVKARRGSDLSRSNKNEIVGRQVSVEEVMKEIEKDVIFYEQSGGGVTFSGGEPLLQEEFLTALLEKCRAGDIPTSVDTCGYAPWEIFERISDIVDVFLYDLKIMDDELHQKYTGVSNRLILENLETLAKANGKLVVRVPLVPGITDTDANLGAIAGFLEPLDGVRKIDLLPYNKLSEDKFCRFGMTSRLGTLPTQPEELLDEKVQLFASRGYEVRIGG
jgi:pyruvate formate lyase activating enzyme